ncbi:ABC transporter ATP-binding protein [Pseudostreptobacillus hongkongensis]|uniref:ABC transporter ATP-binding protein n=1 Tax=Pseudostreptobacillus hongkongensis TaxID=1162717 RepID=UPI0028D80FBC|nr:ABC transporter ATP-binding protein [Pseudostreptobacillus hongkongensis]
MNKLKKPENSKAVLKRLANFILLKHKKNLLIVTIGVIIGTIASTSVSLSLKFLIDDYITPLIGQSNPDFSSFYKILTILAIIFIIGTISTFLYNYIMVEVGEETILRIRNELFDKMQSLPIRYFDQNTNGSIMSVYTNDTDTLRNVITNALPQVVTSFLSIVTSFIAMIILNPSLTILSIIVLGLLSYIISDIGKKSGKYFSAQQQSLADVTGYIEERMNGQKVIKIFNHEDISKEEFDKLNEKLFNYNSRANIFSSILGPIVGNVGNLQFVLTAIIGSILLIYGKTGITIGVLVSYLQFTKSFSQPIMQILQQFNSIVMGIAGAERVFNLLDEKPEIDNGTVVLTNIEILENGEITEVRNNNKWAWKKTNLDGSVEYIELKGEVRFNNMTFGYNENKIILDDLNLYAKPGQKLAFVGSTGAGKTTITNLINRFYDVNSGEITYDGINVKDIKKADLRRSLGIVLQDTHLFTGTIMDNIRYGKLDATDEEVYKAASLAHADHFINMLPDKFNTVISGTGDELSQGQKQLLAIARAAIANPPVLILDEATSSIDTRTEKIVQTGMDNLMKGRTVFVIAHRLSTIRNSDAIIVLEHGKIIERGDHEDLIKQKGTYYQLYTGNLELD